MEECDRGLGRDVEDRPALKLVAVFLLLVDLVLQNQDWIVDDGLRDSRRHRLGSGLGRNRRYGEIVLSESRRSRWRCHRPCFGRTGGVESMGTAGGAGGGGFGGTGNGVLLNDGKAEPLLNSRALRQHRIASKVCGNALGQHRIAMRIVPMRAMSCCPAAGAASGG